jgi:hypothetical protein
MFDPRTTYLILLVVQTLHLLHHRLAKRHISFAEVSSSALLCVPIGGPVPAPLLMGAHLLMAAVQVIGSFWIKRLSPSWEHRES